MVYFRSGFSTEVALARSECFASNGKPIFSHRRRTVRPHRKVNPLCLFSLTPRKARATGLVVRRVILRLTSKPTSMGWLRGQSTATAKCSATNPMYSGQRRSFRLRRLSDEGGQGVKPALRPAITNCLSKTPEGSCIGAALERAAISS